jgi:hypothetical protein
LHLPKETTAAQTDPLSNMEDFNATKEEAEPTPQDTGKYRATDIIVSYEQII